MKCLKAFKPGDKNSNLHILKHLKEYYLFDTETKQTGREQLYSQNLVKRMPYRLKVNQRKFTFH